jgi:hypothetical protein
MGYAAVFRMLGLANLVVIPLVFVVTDRFAAMWARAETDLIVEE